MIINETIFIKHFTNNTSKKFATNYFKAERHKLIYYVTHNQIKKESITISN